jgi:hypothetical protein
MMKRCFQFKNFLCATIALLCLIGCAGADTPFTLVDQTPPHNGGTTPPSSNPATSGQGCLVTFSSQIVLKTKLTPGASSSADPTGLVTSDPHDMPPIKLHFNGSTVTLIGDEFQEGELVLGTQNIRVRQKAGTQASGTYTASDGSISLSGVEFEITSPLEIPLPSFTLTTGDTGSIHGNFGDLTAHGVPIDSNDKGLTLVGGFQIATFPLAEYIGAAVTVQLEGTLDSVPDPATCTGEGASGLILKEVVTNPDHSTSEVALGSDNTLGFGRVFVAQSGVDSPAAGDERFSKTKTLRVKNLTSEAVSGTISNPQVIRLPERKREYCWERPKIFRSNSVCAGLRLLGDECSRHSGHERHDHQGPPPFISRESEAGGPRALRARYGNERSLHSRFRDCARRRLGKWGRNETQLSNRPGHPHSRAGPQGESLEFRGETPADPTYFFAGSNSDPNPRPFLLRLWE